MNRGEYYQWYWNARVRGRNMGRDEHGRETAAAYCRDFGPVLGRVMYAKRVMPDFVRPREYVPELAERWDAIALRVY